MEKDVIISIKGMQFGDDQEPDTIELVTEGRLEHHRNQGYTLSYQETELTGLEGTLTTFHVEGERITLMRVGGVSSQMVFEKGRRHLSMYDTPFGSMTVGVNTRTMTANLTEQGGRIEIDYALEIDHAVAGTNTFLIDIKEANPGCGLVH